MKKCEECNKLLELNKFNKYTVKNGEIRYRNQCGICRGSRYYKKINAKKRKNYDPSKKHEYYQANKEKIKARTKARHYNKRKTDVLYNLIDTLRNRTFHATRRKFWRKTTKFYDYIGCTLEELKIHLESQFQPGMTWDNHTSDGWHIDHKISLASAKTSEELYKLCHYSNLQPLWAIDNKRKGSRVL